MVLHVNYFCGGAGLRGRFNINITGQVSNDNWVQQHYRLFFFGIAVSLLCYWENSNEHTHTHIQRQTKLSY